MEFSDVIKARHSIRTFSDEEVDDAQVMQALECARLAPSWANKQCWSFVVVRDRDKIRALAKAAGAGNRWLGDASLIVAGCGSPDRSGTRQGIGYFAVDVAIAMEHIILAAADQGLGTCWIGHFDEGEVRKILGIPEEIRVVAMTPIGHPADKASVRERVTRWITKGKKRRSLDEIVHNDQW